jgi:uncharacterized protein (TIGR02145 family)
MRKYSFILLLLLSTTGLLLYCSGPTEPELDNPYDQESGSYVPTPDLNTAPVTPLSQSAITGGEFINDYGKPVTGKGVCWSTNENPDIEDSCTNDGEGIGTFESQIEGLEVGTTYNTRAYATNEDGTIYGNQRNFTTQTGIPELETGDVESIRALSAVGQASLGEANGSEVLDWGLCYYESQNLDEEICLSAVQKQPLADGALKEMKEGFSARVSQVDKADSQLNRPDDHNTERTAAQNALSTIQLQERRVTDRAQARPTPVVGDLETEQSRIYEVNPAESDNGLPALKQPSDSDTKAGTGIMHTKNGQFTVELTNLQPDADYIVRAWALNEAVGISYGNEVQFTTMDGIATITTAEATEITAFSAITGGEITDDGGAEIDERGICYATIENPSFDDTCITSGTGLGSFTIMLEELINDTAYYVRAFAENEIGLAYGSQKTFTTRDGLPTVITSEPFDISAFSAKVGGTVISDGGSPVTSRGVCYATTENPSFDDICVATGAGLGSFTVILEDLITDTTYFVRAFVENTTGIKYGINRSFTPKLRDDTEIIEIINPATGQTWMDRNLGASRAATSSTDSEAYGDLYQWGRSADGHQYRYSSTTSTLSSSNQPGHGYFILAPDPYYDWRSPQNDDLWQGVDGINNPCPDSYRLPTGAEWEAERNSWSNNNASGAFNSPLKLPMAGIRSFSSGSLIAVGSHGYYWSSTVSGSTARFLYFNSSPASMNNNARASGLSVRCLED